VGAKLFHENRRTDRQIVGFHSFANMSKNHTAGHSVYHRCSGNCDENETDVAV